MKVGYPCLGANLGWKSGKTFRLASYSEERLYEAVEYNLESLRKTLVFNVEHGLLFFRVSSDLVPFASHEVNQAPWQQRFRGSFREIGEFIARHGMRISAHPDQFVLINSPSPVIFERSVAELAYHAEMLDLLGLDRTHKMQIHVGGVYGDKESSIARFIERYAQLSDRIRAHLVIENDDRLYTLDDCLRLHEATGVPILFDSFHHELNANRYSLEEAFRRFQPTWSGGHGLPMVDYSSQEEGERMGKHCSSIELNDFRRFVVATREFDFDLMLEIKDKEASALLALAELRGCGRIACEQPVA